MVVEDDEAVVATTPVLHDPTEMEAPVQAVQHDHTVQVVLIELQQLALQTITVQHERQHQLHVQTGQLRQVEVELYHIVSIPIVQTLTVMAFQIRKNKALQTVVMLILMALPMHHKQPSARCRPQQTVFKQRLRSPDYRHVQEQ